MPAQTPHILRDFDAAIAALRGDVLAMAAKTRFNLEAAVNAVLSRNSEAANAVIAEDDEVDELERSVDRLGMDILIRFRPVASDLRLVISSMKIAMNLERISDHATSIAKRARKLSANTELPDANLIEPLYTMADQILRDAIASYSDRNAALGASLHARDKELDKLHKETTSTFSSRIDSGAFSGRSEDYVHLILIVRSLERVGDLAVNIGEDAVYLEAARDLRHEKDRSLPPPP
jgi:phosphate transport system protein